MLGSGREALPGGQEALSDVRKRSGGPQKGLGVVKRHSRMSGSGRETLPDVLPWSGGPPGCPGVFGRPSRLLGSGREGLRDVSE